MGSYFYSDFVKQPCLPYILHEMNEINFMNGLKPDMLWSAETRVLKVTWSVDLTLSQRGIQDGIVVDSDGLVEVVKNRTQIMSELFWAARKTPDGDGTVQIIRLMDAIDTLHSFTICLDNYNYLYALMRLQIPLAQGKITQEDFDLVASKIPSAEFVEG